MLRVLRQDPVPAIVRGEGGFGDLFGMESDRWVVRDGWIEVETDVDVGSVGFDVRFPGTAALLGVKRPSLKVGMFKGVSIRLLRRGGAASDKLLDGIEVAGVDTGTAACDA